jgi:F0F1-type ATP synthase gamma subunit
MAIRKTFLRKTASYHMTRKITKAMQMVAAPLRRAQEAAAARPMPSAWT